MRAIYGGRCKMAEVDLLSQVPALIEKGGLPAMVGGGLLALMWKFGGRREDPEAKLTAALNALAAQVQSMDGKIETMNERFKDKMQWHEDRMRALEDRK